MADEDVNTYQRNWRAERRASGGCIYCGGVANESGYQCSACAEKGRQRIRDSTDRAIESGICSRCRRVPARENRKICQGCQDKLSTPEKRLAKRCGTYGITVDHYHRLHREQGGVCAICGNGPQGRWRQLDIDHDHQSGRVRGLLCHNCNKGMGCLGDDVRRLEKAIAYLSRHSR